MNNKINKMNCKILIKKFVHILIHSWNQGYSDKVSSFPVTGQSE